MGDVGRNDPRPCRSCKKYCALARPRPAQEAPEHAIDREFVRKMFRFGLQRFGEDWDPFAEFPVPHMQADESTAQLMAPWAVYEARFDGQRVVDIHLALASATRRPSGYGCMKQWLTSLSIGRWRASSRASGRTSWTC